MVKCSRCKSAEAVVRIPYARLNLCHECFSEFVAKKVLDTVRGYRLFSSKDVVAVALSGGKDSASLLHILVNGFSDVEFKAFHINLGIKGYSERCLKKTEELVRRLNVDFIVYSLEEEEGIRLDDFMKTRFRRKICSTCGLIKRRVFIEAAHRLGADVLVTAHNLDDTVEAMFSCFIAGDFKQLVKLKPALQPFHPKLVKKVKPFFKITEYESLLYAKLNELPFLEDKCPYGAKSRSIKRKRLINMFSEENPGFKHQLLSVFVKKLIPILEKELQEEESVRVCEVCGYPSSTKICGSCRRILEVKSLIQQKR